MESPVARTLRIIKMCDDCESRTRGLMGTEIRPDECALFLFDSPRRLSFWGHDTPQDLWLNCVEDGFVTESHRIRANDDSPVLSLGKYVMAFESLGQWEQHEVELLPDRIMVI